MRLRPPESFLQLLLGLLHELERLRAVAVVMVGGFLELLFGAIEIAYGGVHVGMAAGARRALALRRRRRRRRARRLCGDRRGDEHGGQPQPRDPEISSHGMSLLRLSVYVRASAARCAPC